MPASLIRSHALVTHAIDRHRWDEITDGAVLQEDGRIVEIGTYQELSRKPQLSIAFLADDCFYESRSTGLPRAAAVTVPKVCRLPAGGDSQVRTRLGGRAGLPP